MHLHNRIISLTGVTWIHTTILTLPLRFSALKKNQGYLLFLIASPYIKGHNYLIYVMKQKLKLTLDAVLEYTRSMFG
jgi:hypothetical protein